MASAAGASSIGGAGEAPVAAPADLAAWDAAPGQPLQRVYEKVDAVRQLLQAPRISKRRVLSELEVLEAELGVAAAVAASDRQVAERERQVVETQVENAKLKKQASAWCRWAAVWPQARETQRAGQRTSRLRLRLRPRPPSVPLCLAEARGALSV